MSGHTNQEVLDAWGILETYVPERIRHLGITNMTLSMLELLYNTAKIKPAVVQNRFTMARRNEIALRNFCTERGIVYQTYSKLSKKETFLNGKPVMALARAAAVPRNAALTSLVMNMPNVAVIIDSPSTKARMKEELARVAEVRTWAFKHTVKWERLREEFKALVDMEHARQVAEGASKGLAARLEKVQRNVEAHVQEDASKADL